ncbi:hypothetical protein [uncultured Erythrobacter sp.]|uniref:hypothetical protein n=1 Tax=uncultured Erythrobacter sp. TaxID=263913 RepID=UPI002658D58A|nr:hypothetical protein [uncultured Erythrobacter sp.]
MNVPPLLIQTMVSLAAILALAGLAWRLKLGGSPTLTSDDDVRRAAGEVEDGFDPVAIARDGEGVAAIARDAQGRIMVIKRHGNRFTGRMLDADANATLNIGLGETVLVVRTGQTLFGDIYLAIDDPQAWVATINGVSKPQDA